MITDPDYRQDVWRECISQMLEVCDEAVVVVGKDSDVQLVNSWAGGMLLADRVFVDYLEWPQPEWCYSELPKHLNRGLKIARARGADWIIKFDSDCFIHERDKDVVREHLERDNSWALVSDFVKLQFIKADRAQIKTRVALAIKGKSNVWYGKAEDYNDLCQPIVLPESAFDWKWDKLGKNPVPIGTLVPRAYIAHTGQFVWNYSYTFKTEERAKELLYYFDLAHASFWGQTYGHRKETTPELSFADFMDSVVNSAIAKSNRAFQPEDHPRWIVDRIKNIKPEEFGHSLWGKIEYK